ncbi:hypothetical protein AncyloWKF20_19865 [Ancylobacter sp. WKF20]|uniref:GTP pyrophosphokinase n=1 Tax=Ancylobacter sp. WKF20 TaxID=3039801 RepID=UPI00243420A4|nr:hypothetical protein [Ancylobacter sp. WKF20]WGD29977.1 hypothetical protein AncyloWKF20_19865 [Ancylobacter sp. WKF20]
MPFSEALIDVAVKRYQRERDRYSKLAERVAEICRTDICEENAIRAQVTFRSKTVKSFEGKLRRFSLQDTRNYQTVDEIFDSISDLAGVRVATYRFEDCALVESLLKKSFSDEIERSIRTENKDKNLTNSNNFYRSIHSQVYLPDDELIGIYDNLDDISCEIQICTMISHVWNEIEHDIVYKPTIGSPSEDERFLLRALGQNVRLGDEFISRLISAFEKRTEQNEGPFADIHDFVTKLKENFQINTPSLNSGHLFDQLKIMNINSIQKIKDCIGFFDGDLIRTKIESFNDYLRETSNDLKMSPDTSDILLIPLFNVKLAEIIESHKGRVGRGHGRPSRLYRLARRYQDYQNRGAQIRA